RGLCVRFDQGYCESEFKGACRFGHRRGRRWQHARARVLPTAGEGRHVAVPDDRHRDTRSTDVEQGSARAHACSGRRPRRPVRLWSWNLHSVVHRPVRPSARRRWQHARARVLPTAGEGRHVAVPDNRDRDTRSLPQRQSELIRMSYPALKRLFDIVWASIGLLLLLPVGLLIGLLIKLTGGGPIFYGQTRVGQFGKPFRIWKFRSMIVHADQMGPPLTKGEDARITWIGRFLRKTK